MSSAIADREGRPPAEMLSGVQRAAALMLTLGEEEGARILEFLSEGEIRALSAAMAEMGNVSAAALERLVAEFDEAVASYSSVAGSVEKTEALLGKALPAQQAKDIIEQIRKPSRSVWKKLSILDRGTLSAYLRREHPQTAALILARIDPELAAKILATFPQPVAVDVIDRMLKLQPVRADVLEELEENLENDLLVGVSGRRKPDPHAAMADVFNNLDRQAEARLMDGLEQVNDTSSKRIRALMFTFEDLIRLDAAAIQTVIRAADKTGLAKALQGVSELISNVFLSNMSSRAAKVLSEDIAALNDLPRNEIEAAQAELVRLAKSLMDKGEIANPKRVEDAADLPG